MKTRTTIILGLLLIIGVLVLELVYRDINKNIVESEIDNPKITVSDYSNKHEPLPKSELLGVILENVDKKDKSMMGSLVSNFNKYPTVASRFLPAYTVDVSEFDVDRDDKSEQIIWLSAVDANHPPQYVYIVKNDQIIFSASIGGTIMLHPNILEAPDHNGFYLEWVSSNQVKNGLCCPSGKTITRFIYQDDVFKPIMEKVI